MQPTRGCLPVPEQWNEAMAEKMGLMAGKQGLVMGVANDRSIAWGIAKALHEHGARLAFTYQGDALGKRVRPLAESVDSNFVIDADVTSELSLDAVFAELAERWGRLDFLVHAIAFSDKNELTGKYLDTTRANFLRTMEISCFSFTDACRRAVPLMTRGGSLLSRSALQGRPNGVFRNQRSEGVHGRENQIDRDAHPCREHRTLNVASLQKCRQARVEIGDDVLDLLNATYRGVGLVTLIQLLQQHEVLACFA